MKAVNNAQVEIKNPIIRETKDIIPTHTISIFCGPRTSSAVTLISDNMLLFSLIKKCINKKENTSNRDKNIRKIENCKIFEAEKIYHITDKNPLIAVRNCTRKNTDKTHIDKAIFFRKFVFDIIISQNSNNCKC